MNLVELKKMKINELTTMARDFAIEGATVQGEMGGLGHGRARQDGLKLGAVADALHQPAPHGRVVEGIRPASIGQRVNGLRRPDACDPWRGAR